MGTYRSVVSFGAAFEEFMDGLPQRVQRKVLQVLRIIEEIELIPASYMKHLSGTKGLYEIRIQMSGDAFRIFCFFDEKKLVVLLGGFQKKSTKTPRREIQKALKLKEEYYIEKQS